MIEPGRMLLHYRVLRKIGEGGMGEVYLAEDTRLGREVALKLLSEQWARDPERLARFAREARAVAALNHPNIVTIFSVEEAEGLHFLTMERIQGATLGDRIPPGGMGISEFLSAAIPLAEAMQSVREGVGGGRRFIFIGLLPDPAFRVPFPPGRPSARSAGRRGRGRQGPIAPDPPLDGIGVATR